MDETANATIHPDGQSGDEPSIMWTVWPARSRPIAACGVIVVVLVAAVFATLVMGSPWAGVLGGLFLVHALRGFFFPTIYRIDRGGVFTQCLAHRSGYAWRRIRRFRYDANGGFLSPRAGRSFLDRFAGLHLTWDVNGEAAVPLIEQYMGCVAQSQENHRREAASCGTI